MASTSYPFQTKAAPGATRDVIMSVIGEALRVEVAAAVAADQLYDRELRSLLRSMVREGLLMRVDRDMLPPAYALTAAGWAQASRRHPRHDGG